MESQELVDDSGLVRESLVGQENVTESEPIASSEDEDDDGDIEEDEMTDNNRKETPVVTLDRDNYQRWSIEIKDALRANDLWLYAAGIETKIEEPKDPESGDYVREMKSFLKFDSKDAKARSIIRRTLDAATFQHVQDCATSFDMLKRLRETRDPRTTDILMSSMTSFFAEKWKDADDVTSFMARLAVNVSKVNACNDGIDMDDRFTIAKTLTSLPSKFGTFVQSWNLVAVAKPTLAAFREKLMSAERGLQQPEAETLAEDALFVKAKGAKKFPKDSRNTKLKFNGTCFGCGKKGHRKADCRNTKKTPDVKDEKASEPKDDTAQVALSAFVTRHRSAIIADSGASRHLTGNVSWFHTIRKLEQPVELAAAAGEIKGTHVGDIDVEVSIDGTTWKSGTWSDVLYVPGLDYTLFSTTWMSDKGFAFGHDNQRMTLTKGRERSHGRMSDREFTASIHANQVERWSGDGSADT